MKILAVMFGAAMLAAFVVTDGWATWPIYFDLLVNGSKNFCAGMCQ